jgi:hypothetical protein
MNCAPGVAQQLVSASSAAAPGGASTSTAGHYAATVGERRKADKEIPDAGTEGEAKKTRCGELYSAVVIAQHDALMMATLSVAELDRTWWAKRSQSLLKHALSLQTQTLDAPLSSHAEARILALTHEVNEAAKPVWKTTNRASLHKVMIQMPEARRTHACVAL